MGRKAKCSSEEKVRAVEDYLNGIRSISEIMDDLSIKSHRSVRNWVLAYQQQGAAALLPTTKNQAYTKEFKVMVVEKYIAGEMSVTDLCAKYGIKAHHTLQQWISLYNSDMELKDYNPKQEVYMAEARRKTTIEERKEIVEYCINHEHNYKDIDNFKQFNDTFGHAAGDECLQYVGQALKAFADEYGFFAARYGGEEFALMMPQCGEAEATECAQVLLNSLRTAAPDGSTVTVSIGVSIEIPTNYGVVSSLIKKADGALYQAKEDGRNKYVVAV